MRKMCEHWNRSCGRRRARSCHKSSPSPQSLSQRWETLKPLVGVPQCDRVLSYDYLVQLNLTTIVCSSMKMCEEKIEWMSYMIRTWFRDAKCKHNLIRHPVYHCISIYVRFAPKRSKGLLLPKLKETIYSSQARDLFWSHRSYVWSLPWLETLQVLAPDPDTSSYSAPLLALPTPVVPADISWMEMVTMEIYQHPYCKDP